MVAGPVQNPGLKVQPGPELFELEMAAHQSGPVCLLRVHAADSEAEGGKSETMR